MAKKVKHTGAQINMMNSALERASFSDDPEVRAQADKDSEALVNGSLSEERFQHYLSQEQDFRALTDGDPNYDWWKEQE